jgi:hypothetical protein
MGCGGSIEGEKEPNTLIYEDVNDIDNPPQRISTLRDDKTVNQTFGTVVPYKKFRAEVDARKLRDAMKGHGTDEATIIKIVGNRTSAQLKQVAAKYNGMFKRNLENDLTGELTGNFQHVCVGRLYVAYEYDAYVLHRAMKGIGTDEDAIIDVLCTKTGPEMKKIKEIYIKTYRKNLRKELIGELGGDFEDFILELLKGEREEATPDTSVAFTDTKQLLAVKEKSKGKVAFNKAVGIRLLTARSFDHLREVSLQYKKATNVDMQKAIEKNIRGDLKKGMITLIRWIKDPVEYYCQVINGGVRGLGTDEKSLIRCVLSRCEVDMVDIKKRYYEIYHKRLDRDIYSDTSGDFKQILYQLTYTSHDKGITRPNDLLDASYEARMKFFKEHTKRRRETKSEAGVQWKDLQKHSVMSNNQNFDEADNRFFGGTLRSKSAVQELEMKKQVKPLFPLNSPLQLVHNDTEPEESKINGVSTGDVGTSSRNYNINPRASLFNSLPVSRVHTSKSHMKRNSKRDRERRSKSASGAKRTRGIDELKRQSTLTKVVPLNLSGRDTIQVKERKDEKKVRNKKKRKSNRKADREDMLS